MLIDFKVANYRSVREEQTLSMVASNYSDELPQNLISCERIAGLKGTKLVKAVAIYGANASGKSNIIAALRFLAQFVRDSATKLQPGASTGVEPFKLDEKCLKAPTKFEITIVINDVRVLYGLELTHDRVTSEYLIAYPKGRPQVWFERDWNAKKEKYEWSRSTIHFKHDAPLRDKTRENAGFVSVAAQFDQPQSQAVHSWFKQRLMLWDLARAWGSGAVARSLSNNKATIRTLSAAVAKADIGVVDLQFRDADQREVLTKLLKETIHAHPLLELIGANAKPTLQRNYDADTVKAARESVEKVTGIFKMPVLLHKGSDRKNVALSFQDEESAGTQRYLEVLAELSFAASSGTLMPIDEIEASLHVHLAEALLRSFFAMSNTSGGQLIFTTHNPLLLDHTLLRRDQVWFTEKDQTGATRLYPLTDFKPRKDESLVKGYLAGRYGGIPFIPEGMKL